MPALDISINNQGSIVLLHPNSEAAVAFFRDNVDASGQRWHGAYVVEPRYVQDILDGAEEEGLSVG